MRLFLLRIASFHFLVPLCHVCEWGALGWRHTVYMDRNWLMEDLFMGFHFFPALNFMLFSGSSLWLSLLGLSLTRFNVSYTNKLNGENIDTIWYFISEIIAWRVSALSSSRAFFSGLSSCCFFHSLKATYNIVQLPTIFWGFCISILSLHLLMSCLNPPLGFGKF